MAKWTPTHNYGLRYREHQSRTTGIGRRKRPLRYYAAVYKWQGKTVTDAYGWEGDDFKNYDDVVETALALRQNRRNNTPPYTLRELLEQRKEEQRAHEEAKLAAARELEADQALIMDNVFMEYCEAKHDKKSLKDERGYYKNWIKPNLGSKRLNEISLLDLERIKLKMTKAGKATRSIQYVKAIVRQIYNFSIATGTYSGHLPTQQFLKKQKIDNRRQRYLTPEEALLLLNEIRKTSEQTYRICLLSLNTGMRFGEIASLLWQHVSTDRRQILVIDPKNSESRNVFMTDTIVAMFNEMVEGKPNEIVFPSTNEKKMGRISNTFAKSVNELGLNDGISDRRLKTVFHTLRHSCASWLVNSGVELPVVAKILGHKTLTMTMRYAHVNDTSVKNAMNLLNKQQSAAAPKKIKKASIYG
jgi:integrase